MSGRLGGDSAGGDAAGGAAQGCAELRLLIQAEHDGELDAAQAAGLARHMDACADCQALRNDLAGLSLALQAAALREAAPPGLARRFAPPVPARRPAGPLGRRLVWQLPGFAAGLALAASLALLVLPGGEVADDAGPAVAAHIRALQPGHLLDVPSTDQHTVRPWFAGKLDYAPPVRDFAGHGFALLGGRLDYLDRRPVAALVYRHGLHVIDLFVWPQTGAAAAPRMAVASGYNVGRWRRDGMAFRAVSDMSASELQAFIRLWQGSLAGA